MSNGAALFGMAWNGPKENGSRDQLQDALTGQPPRDGHEVFPIVRSKCGADGKLQTRFA